MSDVLKRKLIQIVEEFSKFEKEIPPNVFDIVEYGKESGSYETRYSRFLRWFLDPRGDHRAGATFANALWKSVKGEERTFSLTSVAEPEKDNIDVRIVDEEKKAYIAIELKVWHKLTKDQLKNYAKYLDDNFKGYDYLRLFVSPEGKEPDEEDKDELWDETYIANDYSVFDEPLKKMIAQVSQERASFRFHTLKLIDDFWFDINKEKEKAEFRDFIKDILQDENFPDIEQKLKKIDIDEVFAKKLLSEIKKAIGSQDHSITPPAQWLVRKIYNELAETPINLDDEDQTNLFDEEKIAFELPKVKEGLPNAYWNEAGLKYVRLTGGGKKGQGLNFLLENPKGFENAKGVPLIYVSGGKQGFPNPYMGWGFKGVKSAKHSSLKAQPIEKCLTPDGELEEEFKKELFKAIKEMIADYEDWKARNLSI